jgi:D-lactate dehydrogenase (cytochrome)
MINSIWTYAFLKARFGEIAEEYGVEGFRWSSQAEQRNQLWRMRHNAYHALMALRPGSRAYVTDVCVPISRLAEAIGRSSEMIADSGLLGPILGHAGDGNFHATLLIEEGNAEEARAAKAIHGRIAELALELGGTITGEHGVGLGKMPYMGAEHGDGWAVMAEIKRALDPGGIMNPGKVVEAN